MDPEPLIAREVMAGKPKKTPKWYEEQMERSRRARELIRRNTERYYAAKAAQERRHSETG